MLVWLANPTKQPAVTPPAAVVMTNIG